jgi:hypothetical protein
MINRPPTFKELAVLRLYESGAPLSIKHASELMEITYDAIATRISLLAGKGLVARIPRLPHRHPLERPYGITQRGQEELRRQRSRASQSQRHRGIRPHPTAVR